MRSMRFFRCDKRAAARTLIAIGMLSVALTPVAPSPAEAAVGDVSLVTTVVGNGVMWFNGDGRPGPRTRIHLPSSVAVDDDDNIFLADAYAHRVRRLDADSGIVSTVAGNGNTAFSGDGGPALAAGISPNHVAFDSSGNLLIAESTRIRRVDASTGIVDTLAGTGTNVTSGDGGPATAAGFTVLKGLAVDDDDNVYVIDDVRIRRIDAVTGVITTVAGGGTQSPTDNELAAAISLPDASGIATTPDGDLYIAGGSTGSVYLVDVDSGRISTVAGTANRGFSGDGAAATAAQLDVPRNVALDADGNLYISDHGVNRIRRVDADSGVITTIAGSQSAQGFAGDGGPATEANLSAPRSMTFATNGDLIIADSGNHRVRRIDAATGFINTILGYGQLNVDGLPATAADAGSSQYPAYDADGNLFVANRVQVLRIDAVTGVGSLVAGDGSTSTGTDGGLALESGFDIRAFTASPTGDLYVGGNGRIHKIDHTTGRLSTVAGGGTADPDNGGQATAAALSRPSGLALDTAGNIFVSDSQRDQVYRVDAVTGLIATVAGTAEGLSGDGGQATAAKLHQPNGLAFDSAGRLYIADAGNSRVRRVDLSTGVITTVAGTSNGFSGDGGAATSAQMSFPSNVAIDSSDNLYINDASNNRLRRVDAQTGTITTTVGTGVGPPDPQGALPVSVNGQLGAATEVRPWSVAIDPSNNPVFASNRRVLRALIVTDGPPVATASFNPTGPVTPQTPTTIEFGCADTVGMASCVAELDGDPVTSGQVLDLTGKTGALTLTVTGIDSDGNVVTEQASLAIDAARPTASPSFTPSGPVTPGTPVTVNFICTDDGTVTQCNGHLNGDAVTNGQSVTFSAEGQQSLSVTAADDAGFATTSTATLNVVDVDLAPTITTNLSDGPVLPGTEVTITFSCEDDLQLTSCTAEFAGATITSPATVSLDQLGRFDLVITAVDSSGGRETRTVEVVVAPFINGEWQPECNRLLAPPYRGTSDLDGAIARFYMAFFGRNPEPEGYDYWRQLHQDQGVSLNRIAGQFLASAEFGRTLTTDELLDHLYHFTLCRNPDEGGLQHWQTQLANGSTPSELFLHFASSAEFKTATDSR